VQPVGHHFAGTLELLMFDRFKSTVPLVGVSPFSMAEAPDPAMAPWAERERTSERVRADIRKDLGLRLAGARADYLVVDNSAAVLPLRELDGRLYTVLSGERTDFMDHLWNNDREAVRASLLRPVSQGLRRQWRQRYTRFIDVCRSQVGPDRLILVRSHVARFWVDSAGTIGLTKSDRRAARLLEALDAEFIRATGCLVADAPLGFFPSGRNWTEFDDGLRLAIEDQVVALCGGTRGTTSAADGRRARLRRGANPRGRELERLDGYWGPGYTHTIADHIAEAAAAGGQADPDLLRAYFASVEATHDDLLALAWLDQEAGQPAVVAECVRLAVADEASLPARQTRERVDRGVAALVAYPGCDLGEDHRAAFEPTLVLRAGPDRFLRYRADGSISRVGGGDGFDPAAATDGRPLRIEQVPAALRSWPLYLERGRRGATAALEVSVASAPELLESCAWLDWPRLLDDDALVFTVGGAPAGRPAVSRVDLSFWFDPEVRVASVSGGMMDQLTEIGAFLHACGQVGRRCVLDDMVYVYKRTHDGFVASQLAPGLDELRISRRVSRSLLESFRAEARTAKFPWPWENPRIWHRLGLRELTVVSPDTAPAVRRAPQLPEIPIVFYPDQDRAAERRLLAEPPAGVPLYVYPIRLVPLDPSSSTALRSVFDLATLPEERFGDRNRTAAQQLRAVPTVALHVRRGDYVTAHHPGWHGDTAQYRQALEFVAHAGQFAAVRPLRLAVFSDDADFVRSNPGDFGLDLAHDVLIVDWNRHFESVWDAYLMSLCPVVVGSVGGFAATAALLASEPNTYVRALPEGPVVVWGPGRLLRLSRG